MTCFSCPESPKRSTEDSGYLVNAGFLIQSFSTGTAAPVKPTLRAYRGRHGPQIPTALPGAALPSMRFPRPWAPGQSLSCLQTKFPQSFWLCLESLPFHPQWSAGYNPCCLHPAQARPSPWEEMSPLRLRGHY